MTFSRYILNLSYDFPFLTSCPVSQGIARGGCGTGASSGSGRDICDGDDGGSDGCSRFRRPSRNGRSGGGGGGRDGGNSCGCSRSPRLLSSGGGGGGGVGGSFSILLVESFPERKRVMSTWLNQRRN